MAAATLVRYLCLDGPVVSEGNFKAFSLIRVLLALTNSPKINVNAREASSGATSRQHVTITRQVNFKEMVQTIIIL